jgi:iron(III) transport system ATP-binding protein
MVRITIENAVKNFGDVRALDDVSLTIEKGELFFLLGPSGCGKTTLLRMIAGFYFSDGGRILFDDRDVSLTPPHKRNTGMVFQNYALWPHMSVRENLTFGLEMHKVSEKDREERVSKALEMVQMHDYAERSPNQLSGGQQQRVALGRALVLEPDVLLLDEPLSNLDARLRLEMRDQIARIHEELDLTMVYVTHDQAEALSMADRMAIMQRGKIGQLGAPREVYHRPHSRFVADFIGETNLISGTVSDISNGQITVETALGPMVSALEADVAVGDAVGCSIRPEHIRVTLDGGTGNVIDAQVLRVFFLGNHEQYFFKLQNGDEWKALAYASAEPLADAGASVRLSCEPNHVVILKEDVI